MQGGFWIRRRGMGNAAAADGNERALHEMGYVTGSEPVVSELGVTLHDTERAGKGWNLYSSAHAPEAFLTDMAGEVRHTWGIVRDVVWPQLENVDKDKARRYFRRVHLLADGSLLAIFEYTGIVKLDVDSNLIWAHLGANHHDSDVDADGRVYVLGKENRTVAALRPRPLQDDNVTILNAAGELVKRIWISECLLSSTYSEFIEAAQRSPTGDVFHTNTIELLDGSLEHLSPAHARGNLLLSLRNLNALAILDPVAGKIVWAAGGPWRMQHQPVLLASGKMLLFDNRTVPPAAPADKRSSRVIEFDPLNERVLWEYAGTQAEPFYSSLCGSVQRLANGNTLVTESSYGRVFELTPDRQIVWEFRNPHTAGPRDEFIAMIPEMIRLDADYPLEHILER
jgi:hypothetical protein